MERTLSLDESGDFAAPDAPVCVAGGLLREPPTPEADAILRALLAVPRCTAGAGPMPTVAARGEGRTRLAEALSGAPLAPWIERAGGWDLEQAQRWARVATSLRAEDER